MENLKSETEMRRQLMQMRSGPRENRGRQNNNEASRTSLGVPRPSEVTMKAARECGEDEFELQDLDEYYGIWLESLKSLSG